MYKANQLLSMHVLSVDIGVKNFAMTVYCGERKVYLVQTAEFRQSERLCVKNEGGDKRRTILECRHHTR